MAESESALLYDAAQQIGISLSDTQISQLIGYVDLMEKWNRAFNLTETRCSDGTGGGLPRQSTSPMAVRASPRHATKMIRGART